MFIDEWPHTAVVASCIDVCLIPDTTVVVNFITFGLLPLGCPVFCSPFMLVCSRTALSPIVNIRDLSSVTAPPYYLFSHAKGEGRQKRGTTKSTALRKGRSTLPRCRRIVGTPGCQRHAAAAVAASAYTDVGASRRHLVGTRRTGDCIF